jgi:pSer/pThr/pTyr-binding forkhead associated (FHA) protein
MAADASDEGKGGGDKTRLGSAPPPQLKRPSEVKPAEAASAAPPPAGPAPDRTQASGAPPPISTPRAAPAGQPAAQDDAEEEEGTVIVSAGRAVSTLQRVQPPGHSEVIRLDRTSYLLGRSRKCDVPLHSATASREHAQLTLRAGGWYIEPVDDKLVVADGEPVRGSQRLTHKMRLQLGADELLFFDSVAAVSASDSRGATATPAPRRGALVALAVMALAALGVAAWWLLLKR